MARVAAVQSCPELIRAPATAPCTAASRAASSKTTNGALPPNSRLVGLGAALAVAVYVTKVPVPFLNKGQSRTVEQDAEEARKNKDWDPNAPLYGKNPAKPAAPAASAASAPASAPAPVTTLSTPSGRPASVASRASVRVVNGVISAGLITTEQPAARAGMTFHTAICSG